MHLDVLYEIRTKRIFRGCCLGLGARSVVQCSNVFVDFFGSAHADQRYIYQVVQKDELQQRWRIIVVVVREYSGHPSLEHAGGER